ncbi:MAG: hypothetical protein ACYC64_17410 [Armatimonadota bacterium]
MLALIGLQVIASVRLPRQLWKVVIIQMAILLALAGMDVVPYSISGRLPPSTIVVSAKIAKTVALNYSFSGIYSCSGSGDVDNGLEVLGS